jgi:hypothetical protein
MAKKANTLVGTYFHSFKSCGCLQYTGEVIKAVENDRYLVLVGTCQKLVNADQMLGWNFYESERESDGEFDYRIKYKNSLCGEHRAACEIAVAKLSSIGGANETKV